MNKNWISTATAKDKEATATARLKAGSGKILIKKKIVADYFKSRPALAESILELFKEIKPNYDLQVQVKGGGIKGQSDAIRLAAAKAVVEVLPEFKLPLKAKGFLHNDPRRVESKKIGQPKARKKIQFSKR
jgi:small subunit ribosomal protein S9